MEPTSSPEPRAAATAKNTPSSTPWGVFIGLILILAIIVSGAYYSFSKRLAPLHNVEESSETPHS